MIKQARKGFLSLINEDPQTFTYPVSGSQGIPVGWPGYVPAGSKTFKGRIAHERSIVNSSQPTPAGASTTLSKFLSYPYTEGELQKDDIITDTESRRWKIGQPDPLRKFGGVFGYQAPLQEVD